MSFLHRCFPAGIARSIGLATIAVFVFVVILALGNMTSGIQSIRVMRVFQNDEVRIVEQVIRNLKENRPDPHGYFNYGYFYNAICFATVKVWYLSGGKLSEYVIALACRLVSLAGLLASALLVFAAVRRATGDRVLACAGAVFLTSIPDLFDWGQYIHPDTLQVVWIAAAIFILLVEQSVRSTLGAACLTGLAFGTKYSGIFLLPFVPVPLGLKWLAEGRRRGLSDWFTVCLVAVVLFLLAWLITNPYVFPQWYEFGKDFIHESGRVARGHWGAEPTNPLLWFPMMWSEFSPVGFILIALGILAAVVILLLGLKQKSSLFQRMDVRVMLMLVLYIGAGLAYLLFQVNMRRFRYVFHLLPAMVILAAWGFHRLTSALKGYSAALPQPSGGWKNYAFAAVTLALWLAAATRLVSVSVAGFDPHRALRDPRILVGQQMELAFPENTPILAEVYSYIPERYSHVTYSWGVDYDQIQAASVQVIVLTRKVSGRYCWKKPGTSFQDQEFVKSDFDKTEHFATFKKQLFSDPDWVIRIETPAVVVLERVTPSGNDASGKLKL